MSTLDFDAIMNEAREAANAAGDKWIAEHTKPAYAVMQGNQVVDTLLDVCGFGFVQVTDKRTSFAKYLKKVQNGYNETIQLNHKHRGRQEWSLNEVTAYAIAGVLRSHGIKGISVYSRID